MRLLALLLFVLLVSCASPAQVTELEANLTASTTRVVALEAQLAEQADLLNRTSQDLRKYDQLYEQKVREVRSLEQQLTVAELQAAKFEEEYASCLVKYAPKVTPSTNGYATIPYDDLMRYSDEHVGERVRYRGEVLQVSEHDDGSFTLRIAVTEEEYFFTDPVWVEYDGPRVLEDDLVLLYGTFAGLQTYTAVLGNEVTIPAIEADTITVIKKAGER